MPRTYPRPAGFAEIAVASSRRAKDVAGISTPWEISRTWATAAVAHAQKRRARAARRARLMGPSITCLGLIYCSGLPGDVHARSKSDAERLDHGSRRRGKVRPHRSHARG